MKPVKPILAAVCMSVSLLISPLLLAKEVAVPAQKVIKIATTTSTENSGLLHAILPSFETNTGYEVQVIAVGSGKALKMGEDGDVDVVLSHAPAAEQAFIEKGFGEKRYAVMYNDFIVLGPSTDPASLKTASSTAEAFGNIAKVSALFISRGDDSGTHKKELDLWQAAQIKPEGKWYREAGQGMAQVIQMAGELAAYTLADRGTWLAVADKSPLTIVYQGEETLFNLYGIMAVSPKRYPDINYAGAQALIDWLISSDGQQAMADFKVKEMSLFIPNAGQTTAAEVEKEAQNASGQ